MKKFGIALMIVVLAFDCMASRFTLKAADQQAADDDLQQARQLAIEFTTGLVRTTDLTLLVKDLFQKDFIERYKAGKSKELTANSSRDFYLVPGLEYNSRLLAEASSENWIRFYTAANNFVFFGVMSGIKNADKTGNVNETDLYPSEVIKLLSTNPNLSNMIVRKGKSRAVSSVAEMRQATASLEEAVSLMRRNAKGQAPVNINEKELIKAMQEDELFRPIVETVDDGFFGLSQGTRVMFINTPILFRLILAKSNNKLEILWAEPYTGG